MKNEMRSITNTQCYRKDLELAKAYSESLIIRTDKLAASAKSVTKEYNLDQFLAFAGGDQESLRQILVSFISSGIKNLQLFKQYIEEENIGAIAELSHKMLPLFRQIEVNDIVVLLTQLERNDFQPLSKETYCSIGKSAVEKIEALLQIIEKEEKLVP